MSDPTANQPPTEPDIAGLRARADQAAQLEADNAAQARELAFLRAGVDTTSMLGRMVMAEHQGELTADAIATTTATVREQLGVPTTPTPQPGDPGTPEHQLQQATNALSGGTGEPAGAAPPDQRSAEEEALHWMKEARRSGMTREQSEAAGIGSLLRSAANGDKDVIWDPDAWNAEAAKVGHNAHLAGLPDARS